MGEVGPGSGDLRALPSCSSPWKQDPPFGPLLQVMSALHCDSRGDPHLLWAMGARMSPWGWDWLREKCGAPSGQSETELAPSETPPHPAPP